MTVDTMGNAAREMVARFRDVWNPRPCDFPGVKFQLPAETVTWARWRIQHSGGGQTSLAGYDGKRRFDKVGNIIIQVFTPLQGGAIVSYDAAQLAVNAYEGKTTPSGIWFRSVRPDELLDSEQTGTWWQINVVAEFLYDQIK